MPCVCDAMPSIFASPLAFDSPTLFCSASIRALRAFVWSSDCCTSVRNDALFESTALLSDCCPCSSCEICSCSWIISLETAPVGLGASIDPSTAPVIIAAPARAIDRVRTACLLKSKSFAFPYRAYGNGRGPRKIKRSPRPLHFLPKFKLLRGDEVRPAVFLPAALRLFRAERPLLAPAHRVHAVRRNA